MRSAPAGRDGASAAYNARVVTDRGSRLRPTAAAFVVVAAAVLPFAPVLASGFVADDFFFAARFRDDVQPVASFVWQALVGRGEATTTFYRPAAFVSLWLDARFWADVAWGMHVSQVGLHALVALGVWHVGRRLGGGPRVLAGATLAAVLFAAFPRRVEAVAWVSCRPDVLAAAGAVAMLIVWTRALTTRRLGVAAGAAALWGLSLLAKESTAALPLALLGWAGPAASAPTSWRERARLLTPFAAVAIVVLAGRRVALGAWVGGYGVEATRPSLGSLTRVPRYLAYLVLPPLEGADALLEQRAGTLAAAGLVAVLVAVLLSLAWRARSSAAVGCGAWWLVAAVLPVFTLPISLASTFNDRLLYLPGIGLALVLAGVLARSPRSGPIAVAMLAVVSAVATHGVASRWHQAGGETTRLVRQLAEATRNLPDDREIVLAAVPDSLRGAYMLRNGVGEALAHAGAAARGPVRVVSAYFVDRLETMPVRAEVGADGRLRVAGAAGRREVVPREVGGALVEGPADRYGRYAALTTDVPASSAVFLLTPTRVERLR